MARDPAGITGEPKRWWKALDEKPSLQYGEMDADGAVHQLEGQPPPAHGSAWWPPNVNGNDRPQE